MKKKLLILDDDSSFRKNHQTNLNKLPAVKKHFKPDEITPQQFKEAVLVLEQRRKSARESKGVLKQFEDKCILDETAVLVVDYDLLTLDNTSFMTGENVAYLARCFSRCGFIIGLNQFGNNPFDLTMKGHPESFADLNIGSKQLENPGLWSDKKDGFRPWYWPIVTQALAGFEKRVAELTGHMDEPIFSFLQIPEAIGKMFPRSAVEFISKTKKLADTTFNDFVTEGGLRGGRDRTSEECRVRVAAARVFKWLERLILSGQDILVDAPHLVSRYPSLLTTSKRDAGAFNRAATLGSVDSLGINYQLISDSRFVRADWLSRPAWYWPLVMKNQAIQEVKEPWKVQQPNVSFCEDISAFKAKKDCSEFVADLSSTFVRRSVARLKEIDYRPEVRFSL